MSNLKIGPVDITEGTGKFNVGGLVVGTTQVVANNDGSVGLVGGSHTFTPTGYSLAGTQSSLLSVSGGSGYYKEIAFKTNGNDRWRLLSGGGAESGGNAGSNFYLSRFSDAGVYIDSPISVDRATGAISLNTSVQVPTLDVAVNDNRVASSAFTKACLENIADRTAGDSSSFAANTRFVTNALAASAGTKVTTFNGRSGVVTLSAADVINALGYTPISNTNVVTGISVDGGVAKKGVVTFSGGFSDAGSYITLSSNGSSGFCVHPQSLITMNDDSEKFAQDVRPGDVLKNGNKVLGLLNSTLSTRSWVEVNGKAVVTSDHLVKLNGGWAVLSREQYRENYLGRTFACKTLEGMKEITSDFGDPDSFYELAVGKTLSTGVPISSIKEFTNARNHPVIALYTEQDSFFADGIEVSSMGREVEAE